MNRAVLNLLPCTLIHCIWTTTPVSQLPSSLCTTKVWVGFNNSNYIQQPWRPVIFCIR
jgi:hypothetical protein